MIAGATLALFAASPDAAPRGCADHWVTELDRTGFDTNGSGRIFTANELSTFRVKIDGALKCAVRRACEQRWVAPVLARGIDKVVIATASGATEPHLYPSGKDNLFLEWVFAEQNLGLPADADILAGSACWTAPASDACMAPGD